MCVLNAPLQLFLLKTIHRLNYVKQKNKNITYKKEALISHVSTYG